MSFDTPTHAVARFESPEDAQSWESVDDRVMGGTSSSRLVHVPGAGARFLGVVSLAHGGGFASVRSAPLPASLASREGLALRVRGDGHVYKLCIRTDGERDGVLYQARFAPAAGEWSLVRVAFSEFVPTFRGRVVQAPGLRGEDVRVLGLMISDRQAGSFMLDLASVEAYG